MRKTNKTEKGPVLAETSEFDVRFSEVDSMGIVWHGSYALYFEDAREAFGKRYGLGYLTIFGNGFYAPLVELNFEYKSPLAYGDRARVEITYRNTDAAKIVFDYRIYVGEENRLAATGSSVQVFLDKEYKLVLFNPPFYEEWKKKNGLL